MFFFSWLIVGLERFSLELFVAAFVVEDEVEDEVVFAVGFVGLGWLEVVDALPESDVPDSLEIRLNIPSAVLFVNSEASGLFLALLRVCLNFNSIIC